MAHNTIQFMKGLGKITVMKIGREAYETVSLYALRQHYYNPNQTSLTPLPIWWFGLVFLASIPVSIYSSITGQSTLPASNPMGAFMFIVMVGGLFALSVAHIVLYTHGKYVNSKYAR